MRSEDLSRTLFSDARDAGGGSIVRDTLPRVAEEDTPVAVAADWLAQAQANPAPASLVDAAIARTRRPVRAESPRRWLVWGGAAGAFAIGLAALLMPPATHPPPPAPPADATAAMDRPKASAGGSFTAAARPPLDGTASTDIMVGPELGRTLAAYAARRNAATLADLTAALGDGGLDPREAGLIESIVISPGLAARLGGPLPPRLTLRRDGGGVFRLSE
ncbi:hypothetical protein [Magnetospirillum sp. SS-4]|uniref:hypothetical protein n=1 Tax=Magnetospirillum sp. SS-4 TaxID=2681465 RepID=UPI001383D92C|nr:hypothetical protein [Magnetospirillum sp. SS-4]CAA7617119.1 conserved hypothetical protein [Magnetospirillum sp. SS-4]